ncbi:carbohydrate porin [Neorhodopirellula lusitana]|nr:carbohydrate porin [Neorhodopirellula lusitana]
MSHMMMRSRFAIVSALRTAGVTLAVVGGLLSPLAFADSPTFDCDVCDFSLACDASNCDELRCGCDGTADCGCDQMGGCVCDTHANCLTELGCLGTTRRNLADSGITFQSNITQFYFGTVSGGLDQTDRYGGHGDYVANFDLGKLGLHEGTFVKIRAEHRFGQSIVEPSGAFLPATLATELPTTESRDLYLTNFVITQALSENFIVFGGKVDSLDGDANAFAHGRGITQFSNMGFVANPIALRTVPYSSLGAGFAWLMGGEPLLSFLVMNPTDTTTSNGFDELFADGVALSAELRVPTNFGGLPGHQLFAGTYSTRNYVSLGQDPRIILPEVPIARTSDSWSLYWNTDQYLYTDRNDPTHGWGYFARAGIADDNANPVSYFLSAGIGGNSRLRGREADTFGLGYYYSGTSDELGPFIAAAVGSVGDGQGVEAYYNIQATRNLAITPDAQWISQARESIDDAWLLGVRANLAF